MSNRERIIQIVKEEFENIGKDSSTTDVNVDVGKKITVSINTEHPFQNTEFFDFISALKERISMEFEVGQTSYVGNYAFFVCTVN